MKKLLFFAAYATALAATEASAEFKRITTAEQFNQEIVGKVISDEFGNSFHVKPDGKLSADLNQGKFNGSWQWSGLLWCRNGVLDGKELGTNCQRVDIDGTKARFTPNNGFGRPEIYNIK